MDVIRDLAIEQRKRLVGSICGFIERQPWHAQLAPAEKAQLREKIISSIGSYHDFILDVVKVTKDDGVRNEESITLLRQIHDAVRPRA